MTKWITPLLNRTALAAVAIAWGIGVLREELAALDDRATELFELYTDGVGEDTADEREDVDLDLTSQEEFLNTLIDECDAEDNES